METNGQGAVDIATLKCLNRTMQYGNLCSPPAFVIKYLSLNRTMQYGNELIFDTPPRLFDRLNRTMQYGNLCEKP